MLDESSKRTANVAPSSPSVAGGPAQAAGSLQLEYSASIVVDATPLGTRCSQKLSPVRSPDRVDSLLEQAQQQSAGTHGRSGVSAAPQDTASSAKGSFEDGPACWPTRAHKNQRACRKEPRKRRSPRVGETHRPQISRFCECKLVNRKRNGRKSECAHVSFRRSFTRSN